MGQDASLLLQQVNTLSGAGRFADALAVLERIAAADRGRLDVLAAEANLARSLGQHARAEAAYVRLAEVDPSPERSIALGTLHLDLARHQDAIAAFRRAVVLDPQSAQAWVSLGVACTAAGRTADATAAFQEAIRVEAAAAARRWSIEAALPAAMRPGQAGHLAYADGRPRPAILLAPLPKSGSTWLEQTLRHRLGLDPVSCSSGQFPDDLLDYQRLVELKARGGIARHHFPARPENLWLVRTLGLKVVVSVRDLRQVLWSWLHHIGAARRSADLLAHTVHSPPDHYFARALPWQMDWLIEHHMPLFVGWLEGWQAADAAGCVDLLVIDYREQTECLADVVRRVLALHDIDAAGLPPPAGLPGRSTNLRSGRPEEWREHLTRQQRERITAAVPAQLYARFGWQR